MTYQLTPEQMQQYREEGYIVLRGIIPLEQVEAHKDGINAIMDGVLAGNGLEIPWINRDRRIPERLGKLLRPGWIHPAFIEAIENGPYLDLAAQVLGTPVRYSLFGMLAGGDGKPYIQNWHRDLAPVGEADEEAVIIGGNYLYTQINAPLFPDRYVTIVPRSHLRASTAEELQAINDNPTGDMPGQMTVEMEPGDVAFYYSNIWHRGFNPEGKLRWTMHHAFVRGDAPVFLHESGQADWISEPGYLESLPPRMRSFMQGYLDAAAQEPQSFYDVAKATYEKGQH